MEPRFVDDHERREFIGRESLLELQQLYPDIFKYEIHQHPDKYSVYDCFYFTEDKDTHSIKKRVWIEIKTRDKDFDGYFLEMKKLKDLIKARNDMYFTKDEVTFLYLNFTPTKTLIWNITDIDPDEVEVREIDCNKNTCNSRKDKVRKDQIVLKEEDAKSFKFIADEKRVFRKWAEKYLLPKIIKKQEDLLWNFLLYGPNTETNSVF